MSGFTVDRFLISLMVATLFISSGIFIIGENMQTYGVDYDNEVFVNVSIMADQLQRNATDMKDNIFENPIDDSDTESSLFLRGIDTAKRGWTFFIYAGDLLQYFSTAIGVPAIFVTMGLVSLSVSALFFLVYLIFRVWPR